MLPGVGVFGTSLTSRVIIPLLKDEGFSVKALWGRTQEEAEELAKEMSVPFYTNRIDDVLLHQDVDLVCINLPPPLTKQIAVKTLETFIYYQNTGESPALGWVPALQCGCSVDS
ncbi:glucose-fructose oxidoreductase domain-containing protein 1 isoform 2 precursor [Xenopus tropicalis]|uniref:Glucose-fructose oxidoreductase domain-containing protein 1 isoform 2 precursor n=1 Tax=Xenopus tropicalis TaxID=8364 RepID=A0A8J0PHC5_XENTR|nr:glucose-fructose oxidoreductase domain-containing protein 1 isoform 2 precursor [Xenopus tropicalis]